MIKYREILRLRSIGVSVRNIAYSCECSRSTVQGVINKAKMRGISWPLPEHIDDKEIYRMLFPKEPSSSSKAEPNYEQINKELLRKGVTLTLCWSEYCDQVLASGGDPYQYSAFCHHYHTWAKQNSVVMHIERKPAQQMMVDWAGACMQVIDKDTGEIHKVYIFVACLPYSSYLFAQGFYHMDQSAWLKAHVAAFEHFGGATPILVPDNLKTGIVKNGLDELVVNESYRRLSEYYGCAVVPARVRKPRDKAAVESGVGVITSQAIAPLRNHTFFDLATLNDALQSLVAKINCRPFQKRHGSREIVFFESEKAHLIPLPKHRFEVYVVKTATVPYNYHISVDKIFYSVPFQYVKQEVEVRISEQTVSIYMGAERIAMHKRSYAHQGSYVTNPNHMPDAHKDFTEWTADRFRKWADTKGGSVSTVIDHVLASKTIVQQTYRSCHAIIGLSKKYGDLLLDKACFRALEINHTPSYKTVKALILQLDSDRAKNNSHNNTHAYLRGANYFDKTLKENEQND